MKNNYLCILLISICLNSFAQVINFPDPNFKAHLLESDVTNTIAKDAADNNIKIDANNNGEIEQSEALSVYKLFYSEGGPPPFKTILATQTIGPISNLTGIAAFSNLEYLNVNNNELVSIDLSSNVMLKKLYCGNNLLTSFNLTGLVHLTDLYIRNNQISSLSTAGLPALEFLDCHVNPLLNSLTFNNNPALQIVDCSVCQLTSLDVGSLSGLRKLECSSNSINLLNLGSISQLINLSCSSNQLATLDISNLNQLKTLNCSHNLLTTSFDFSNLPEIINVSCDFNSITSLLFSNNQHLNTVSCNHNNLASLDFSSTGIYKMYANDNPSLAFVNVKNGIITPDVYVSQFPEPPFTSDNFQLQNTDLDYICHDEGEFGPELVSNEELQAISRGSYCSFTPGGNYNTISGNIKFDCDGVNSAMANQKLTIIDNTQSGTTYTNSSGFYQFYSNGTTVNVTPQFPNPGYFTVTPANYNFNFTDFGNTETADFCVAANGLHPDLEITILPLTSARPGFDTQYKIVYSNKGNQLQSGSVALAFDARLDFISALPTVSLQSANSLTWDFANLLPFESREIEVTLKVHAPTETPPVNIDDILLLTLNLNTPQTDETPEDNSMYYNQTVIGSLDPNDKEVVEGPYVSFLEIDEYLHYIVRFQNTGTAAAENVVIKDMLDDNLDWSTLEMVSSSHPFRSALSMGKKLEVFFENINLPGASLNEAESHGYIAYKVKPKPTVLVDDVIENTAAIYFDYNFPILTNTVSTFISAILGAPTSERDLFRIYPNPTSGILNIEMASNEPISKISIVNLLGQTLLTFGSNSALDISPLTKGTYFVTVETDKGRATQKIIKQ